jgi:hypothetical protein
MVIILAIVFLKRAPLSPKIINLYRGKRDGYYLGKTVIKKAPPIDKKKAPINEAM